MKLKLKKRRIGKAIVIEFDKRFDVQQYAEVEKSIHTILDNDDKLLVIDLEKTEYLSSSGLRVLISIMRRIKGLNGQLKLANINKTVRKTFEVVELLDLFQIYPSVKEALADF